MERVLGVFKSRATPQEQLREWQRKLRQEARNVERQIHGKCVHGLHGMSYINSDN